MYPNRFMTDKQKDLVSNRKARHDYEILDTYEAGIALKGTEVKSLRANGGSLQEAYVRIMRDELWLVGCHIAPYSFGNMHNHEDTRDRKLLVHKREIERMRKETQEKGMTLVPLGLYFKRGKIKVKIAVARGKRSVDKRATIKSREEQRRMQRAIRRGGEE